VPAWDGRDPAQRPADWAAYVARAVDCRFGTIGMVDIRFTSTPVGMNLDREERRPSIWVGQRSATRQSQRRRATSGGA
jgi:hypothetical protein